MRKRGTERGARELKTRTENAKQTFLGISRTIAFDTPLSLPATTFFFFPFGWLALALLR